jgi:1,4-dihydroxy-2-naphthoyl-CoA synthase
LACLVTGVRWRKSAISDSSGPGGDGIMAFTDLLVEKIDHIERITLNRPRYRNAQSTHLLKELDQAFEEAVDDDEIKS